MATYPEELPDKQDSSEDLIYAAGPSQAAPRPGESGEFTRAKYVSIGAGYVRANDPSTALRQMSQPDYTAVPTADPNLPEGRPNSAYNGAGVRSLSAMRQNAPSLSAFFNPNVSSSQSSVSSSRSYPYPFPTILPSQPQSRPTSNAPSLMDQLPPQTQPPDTEHTSSSLQRNQKSNGNMPYNPLQAQAGLFHVRGNKNRRTAGSAFSLSPYYASQQDDDDSSSVASQYSTATTMTRMNPYHSGTARPPPLIPVPAPPPRLPPAGPPPPIPMRSPMRQSFAPDTHAYGQQGPVHPLILRRAGRE